MRPLPLALLLLSITAVILLPGCAGPKMFKPTPDPASPASVAGNWELRGTSQTGAQPAGLVGGITQIGSHISGNVLLLIPCDTTFATSPLTGSINGNTVTLTAPGAAGETFSSTLTLNAAATKATGTYTVTGGCATGDHGTLSATKVPSVTGTYKGTATADSDGSTANLTLNLTQSATPTFNGFYSVSGTATATGSPCLVSGTVETGLMIGSVLVFDIYDSTTDTDITIAGHYADPASNAAWTATYEIDTGPCMDQTGTLTMTRQ